MLEFYLDDILFHIRSLSKPATGKIGIVGTRRLRHGPESLANEPMKRTSTLRSASTEDGLRRTGLVAPLIVALAACWGQTGLGQEKLPAPPQVSESRGPGRNFPSSFLRGFKTNTTVLASWPMRSESSKTAAMASSGQPSLQAWEVSGTDRDCAGKGPRRGHPYTHTTE